MNGGGGGGDGSSLSKGEKARVREREKGRAAEGRIAEQMPLRGELRLVEFRRSGREPPCGQRRKDEEGEDGGAREGVP